MSLTLGLLALVLPMHAMNLDSLDGNWAVSVRLDNLVRMDTYYFSSVHSDYYESPSYEGAQASAYLHSEVRSSWGLPTQYSVHWRWKRDLSIGLDGEMSYRRVPTTSHRQWTEGERRDSEISGTDLRISGALEVCKYLRRNSYMSPFFSLSPFLARSSSTRLSESTTYDDGETRFERSERTVDRTRYGVDLNWGGELFFRLGKAKMGLRMKSNLMRIWKSWFEEGAGSDYRREESPLGVDVRLPTEGNYSLWLSFYF